MHGNGAADLQQAHFALSAGVLCTQGRAGLHPQAFAFLFVVAVAYGDAVVVRGAAVGIQIVHQLFQRFFKALLSAACHTAGEDLAILEQDHRLDAQHVGCTARHLADAAALDEIVQIAYREEDLVGSFLCFQPCHSLVQRAACVPHGHGVFHHGGLGNGSRRAVNDLNAGIGEIFQHQIPGIAGAAHTAAHLAGEHQTQHIPASSSMGTECLLKVLNGSKAGFGVGRRVVHHELVEVPHGDLLAFFAVVLAVQRDIEGHDLDLELFGSVQRQVACAVGNDIKHL